VLVPICLVGVSVAQTHFVTGTEVSVRALSIAGLSKISTANLAFVTSEIEDHTYSENFESEIPDKVRYALQTKGYFEADVTEPIFTVPNQSAAGTPAIAVTLTIDQGEQFRLEELTFSKNTAFTTDTLRAQFDISKGDVFDTDKIHLALDELRKLYASRGYINFAPVPNTEVDDKRFVISLRIELDEGAQFLFGNLEIAGNEPQPGTRQELVTAWQPYVGTAYDYAVAERFLRQHHLVSSTVGREHSGNARTNPVDVLASFP
jgi:outer membrane protein assembly factor BamA